MAMQMELSTLTETSTKICHTEYKRNSYHVAIGIANGNDTL